MRRVYLEWDPALILRSPALLSDEELQLDTLAQPAKDALIDFWNRRADGEYTTARSLEHVRQDLRVLCAPDKLVQMTDIAIADEQRHTQWCLAMSERVGGKPRVTARILGDKPLSFSGASLRENRILRAVFAGCISETIALHVLRESQKDIAPRALRQANRQHMSEEVGHAQLGWAFLAWLAESQLLDAQLRRLLTTALPVLCELAERSWSTGARQGYPELSALGFLHETHVQRGLQLAKEEVMLPGFRQLGLEP